MEMATRKRGGRRALLVVLALLLMLLPCAEAQVAGAATETPAWEGTCMANCSKPLFNEFCLVTEDVCAYPTGDIDAYRAVRTVALWSGKKAGTCIKKFRNLMCALYFPKCRYRRTVPVKP
ncbi:hypothetical protein T484DRAFT_2812945 [Baffinella frigidus]|nr:hypothetical protein T484DRAFT_2812945 [Cryptophyta sp. CCMP2293]